MNDVGMLWQKETRHLAVARANVGQAGETKKQLVLNSTGYLRWLV